MKLGDIFSSSMVFAAGRPIRIFGYGAGCATVALGGYERKIASDGPFWCCELPAMEYGGPYTLTFSEGETTVSLEDIYIGEVYLFSGQSNMSMKLSQTNTAPQAYEDIEMLKHVTVLPEPEPFCWQSAKRECVGDWSAIGYLTCREIAKKKNVPVGIITCATGASAIESWMPEGTLEKIGIRIPLEEKFVDHYHEVYGAWNHDGDLYRSKLCRVIPFSLSGVIWYQGESDASVAEGRVYAEELAALIGVFRKDFQNEALPFAIVQLADFEARIAQGEGWRLIQQAQERIGSLTHAAYTVICRDICETDDIHPQTKDKLSQRIAKTIEEHF